ncbi:hypothetical protein [Streptomyces lavendulocolor]|uniref:hypothetical protein n=1 Tax=Streptomyces lavendulocolor TaxID=67316 RepID=UPI003C2AE544
MTPYERLLAEAIPTGTFGDAQPAPHRPQPTSRPWTAQEQLDHRRALETALDGWEYAEDTRTPHTTRHLHPVHDTAA